jgi:hypothetical protein
MPDTPIFSVNLLKAIQRSATLIGELATGRALAVSRSPLVR